MRSKQPILSEIKSQCSTNTPDKVIEIIRRNMIRSEKAEKRIEEEGIVVRDMNGNVVPNPSIKIADAADKIICQLLEKYNIKNSIRRR